MLSDSPHVRIREPYVFRESVQGRIVVSDVLPAQGEEHEEGRLEGAIFFATLFPPTSRSTSEWLGTKSAARVIIAFSGPLFWFGFGAARVWPAVVKANGDALESETVMGEGGPHNYGYSSCSELRRRRRGPGIDAPRLWIRGLRLRLHLQTIVVEAREATPAYNQPLACPPTYPYVFLLMNGSRPRPICGEYPPRPAQPTPSSAQQDCFFNFIP
ncbi:uncharacterized protein BT62DRAFT_1076266 [Guyanagaster necrorhizus]|uniref:Uncharacterized protein n=1 Tax=Guyanagaster necrorhizus TaxID=856835 RepID=A0A9P7VTL3_9AGAR|nr:uncharacterized protein BT62DRAFT_1076266 [Guyanagaster necrorhizus MCA 3950]KAG7445844.1 hypothetical protein BT62DRAFT_1076266 [Guyanagaster necrorhizus MCA 3950]